MIRRMEARRYRCLRRVSACLAPFNILIGPNASGKSTWLDILGFLQDALEQDVEYAVRRRARTLQELVWRQEDPATGFELAVELDIPERLRATESNGQAFAGLRYELGVGVDPEAGIVVQGETLWLLQEEVLVRSESHSPSPQMQFPRDLPDETILHRGPAPKGHRVVARKIGPGRDYYRSERTGWNVQFRLAPQRLALSGVPEDEDRFPVALWLRRFLASGIQILQLNSVAMRQPAPADAPVTFRPDGSNLPLVVAHLRQVRPQRFTWWLDHIRTVFPDIRDIQVVERPEDRSRYLVVVYEHGLRVPSWLLSDGTLRLLALTLLAYLPPQEEIYLIEEPENGIHPRAVEAVFQSLRSVYKGQVLLATHSPLFMALAEPEDLLIFAKTKSGATDVVRGPEHPELARWRSEQPLDTLFASGVLG